jgi:hypothetical protein
MKSIFLVGKKELVPAVYKAKLNGTPEKAEQSSLTKVE